MGADDSEVTGASFAGAFRHGIQPGGWVLLCDALWHGRKVFRIDPAIAVVLWGRGIPAYRIKASRIEHSCSSCVNAEDNKAIWRELLFAATIKAQAVNSMRHALSALIVQTVRGVSRFS